MTKHHTCWIYQWVIVWICINHTISDCLFFFSLYTLGKPLINIQQYKELKQLDTMELGNLKKQKKIISEPYNQFYWTSLFTQYNILMINGLLVIMHFKFRSKKG